LDAVDLGLKDAVIVVTGGAKGVGAAIVELCSSEGAIPVIVDRDEAAVTAIQQKLRGRNHRSEAVTMDLTDHCATDLAVTEIAKKLGRIDALINNAGVNDGVGLENGTPERFTASLQLNLAHCYAMAKTALPFLIASKGAIVNIGSKVAITGQGGTSGYAASKGAILGLTTAWADELAKYEIRVNVVIPAEVLTPQYRTWLDKFPDPNEAERKITSRIPLGHRFTSPAEIASAVLLLLSPSNKMSGQEVYVNVSKFARISLNRGPVYWVIPGRD
jgi:L-fucose dehydrogenase